MAVYDDDDDAEKLKEQEETEASPEADKAEQAELETLNKKADAQESEEPSLFNPNVDRPVGSAFGTGRSKLTKRTKRALLIGSPLGIIVALLLLLAIFVGQLKAVHFATILRSGGFSSFQVSMKRFFADVAFDKSVFAEGSTGPVANRPDSNLLRRLRTGNDPRSVAAQLGREGSIQYIREGSEIKGFQFGGDGSGDVVRYDDIAQREFGLKADDLSFRQRMTLRKMVVDEINLRLGDRLGVEARSFRNDFWTGFRDFTGIRMTRFRQGIRELAGEKPVDAEIKVRLEQEEYVAKGEGTVSSPISKADDAAKAEAEEITNSTKAGERLRNPEIFERALNKIGIKDIDAFTSNVNKASTAVLVGTLYCIAHDLGETGPRINQMMEQRAARYAHDQQTTAEQIKSGNVSPEAVSAVNADWDGVKSSDGQTTIPPAELSPYYVAYTGQSMSKADMAGLAMAPSVHVETPLDWFHKADTLIKNVLTLGTVNLPGFNKGYDAAVNRACNAILDPTTQTIFVVAEVVAAAASGGTSAAAEAMLKAAVFFGGAAYAGSMIENYVQNLAGSGFSGAESGEDRFTSAAIATDYLDQQSSRGVAMGRPLTSAEAGVIKTTALLQTRQEFQNKPWQERYFATDNPYSLVGSLSAKMPSSFASLGNRLIASISSLPQTLASFISGKLNSGLLMQLVNGPHQQVAYAAEGLDFQTRAKFFGVQQWGWSQSEMNRIENDDDFSFDKNAAYVESHPEFEDRFAKCYASNLLQTTMPEDGCDAATLGSDDALHWRLYKVHSFVVDSLNEDVGADNGN